MPKDNVDLYGQGDAHLDPPVGFWATVRYLGPGLILVGSIVGSGELIMTTKLGAQAGFVMMWFVILSCIVKVVVQAEIVRHIISTGQTVLEVFNDLPGPACARPRWFTLPWLTSFSIGVFACATLIMHRDPQTTSAYWIVGGGWLALIIVGVHLGMIHLRASSQPVDAQRPHVNWFLWLFLLGQLGMFINAGAILGGAGQCLVLAFPDGPSDQFWSMTVAVICGALLIGGAYGTLEKVSIALVAGFTLITVVCIFLVQTTEYAFSFSEISGGMLGSLPDPLPSHMVLTILAVYAATGIGHWEMFSYTYWCIEKGYARHAGRRDESDAWAQRARGWVRVMYIDSLLTMVVYTTSTICFYLLGAAILHHDGLDPSGSETLTVLQKIFTGSIGNKAAVLFIVGAFFVLFSTAISGSASGSRIVADALCVLGFLPKDDAHGRRRAIQVGVVVSLVIQAYAFFLFKDPTMILMITALIAVFSYPVLGLGAIYFRYRGVDERIRPGRVLTALLWSTGLILAVASPVMAVAFFWLKLTG